MPTAMIGERIKYERSTLYNIGKSMTAQGNRPNPIVMEQIKQLHIQKCKRGKRSGQINVRRTWDNNQGVNEKNLQTLFLPWLKQSASQIGTPILIISEILKR